MFHLGRCPLRKGSNVMAESAAPHGTTRTLPPPSVNGSTRSPPAPPAAERPRLSTRISGIGTGQIAGIVALIAV
jgi:hypothetical protein